MKKPSLSKDGIQQFFLANGEKLLLGATIVILLGFFYSAITAKPLDESMSPEAIKVASNNLQQQVSQPSWDEKKKDLNLPAPEFDLAADKAMQPAPGTPFTEPIPWNPPLFPELKRRGEPRIYAVDELQAASGAALLAYQFDPTTQAAAAPTTPAAAATTTTNKRIDPNAPLPGAHVQSALVEGKPYVVLTGLVPIDKQSLEYNDKFALSAPADVDPNKPAPPVPPQQGVPEVPVYAVAFVQRREVTPGMKADAPWPENLAPLRYASIIADMSKWAPAWTNQDLVDLNYIFPCDEVPIPGFDPTKNPNARGTLTRLVTMQLPPLVLKDWGMEAAHSKIRLNIPEDASTTPGVNQDTTVAPDTFSFGGDHPADNAAGAKAAAPVANPAPAPAPALRTAPPRTAPAPMIAQAPRGNFPAYGPRRDHDEVPRYGASRITMPSNSYVAPASPQNQSVPNKLFRFVDFSVEPGKTYQYRVQLWLVNPNYGLKPECLEKGKFSDDQWVKSPLTDPTPPIAVPHLYQILADGVTGGRNSEPKAKINFWALFKAAPSETAAVPLPPGQNVWLEGMKENMDWMLGSILTVRDTEFIDAIDPTAMELRTLKTVTVETDQPMLLDVRNDDPLGGTKTKGPTELLMIDSAGRLSVTTSAVDHFAMDDYKQLKTSAAATPITTGAPGITMPEHDSPRPTTRRRGHDE